MHTLFGTIQQQVAAAAGGGPLTVESVTETEFTTDATTHNVAMPATVASGDLLLVVWTNDSTTAVNTPGGWSVELDNSAGSARATIFTKIADGTEGGTTVNFSTASSERGAGHVFRISGWSGSLTNIDSAAVQDSSGTPRTSAALTPAFGTAEAVWIASLHYSGTPVVTTFPSTYGGAVSSNTFTGTTGANLYSCWKIQTVASSTPGDFTFDLSSSAASTQVTTAVKGA